MFGNDNVQPPRAGQPLTESFLRNLTSLAKGAVQGSGGGGYYADSTGVYMRAGSDRDVLRLRCTTEAIPKGGVGKTTGLVTGMVAPPVLEFVKITKLGQRPIFVAEQAAAQNAYTTGADNRRVVEVLYDDTDGTPAVGDTWGPVPSSWKVRKHHHGFKIVKAGNTTTKLALAVYDNAVPWYQGKMDVACGPRETKAVSLYRDDGATGVDLGLNVDALAPFMLAVETIGIGKWVEVQFDSPADRWMISAYQC